MSRNKKLLIFIVILLALAAAMFWYFNSRKTDQNTGSVDETQSSGFSPFGRSSNYQGGISNNTEPSANEPQNTYSSSTAPIKSLRLLSNTPVGGFGASTTGSTTVFRWVDRGRGNIYETKSDTLNVETLSNTLVPRINESSWNKNLNAFIAFSFSSEAPGFSAMYAELRPQTISSSTASSTSTKTPYSLKGKRLPENTVAFAVSPKRDKIFMLVDESGTGVGYVSAFDGTSMKKVFDTPLLQVNADWPEENTITLTTKGSLEQNGYMYFINPKTGLFKMVLGPVRGLSAKASTDAKYIIYSSSAGQGFSTKILALSDGSQKDLMTKTLADKCVWGNFYKNLAYCGVPSQNDKASYPDDWYKGTVSFSDKIWQIDAKTGETHMISSIIDQSDRLIDAFNLYLDSKDNFLIFINKEDLSLWALDLIKSN